ncbi:MAG: hypothetical protein ACRC92_02305 [Peptostreptococcaceae bacterium]
MKLTQAILNGAQKVKEHLDENPTIVKTQNKRLITDEELIALGGNPDNYPQVLYSLSSSDLVEEGFDATPSNIETVKTYMGRTFELWDEDVVYYIGEAKEAQNKLDKELEEEK